MSDKILYDTGEAAAYLGVSESYLEQLRCNGNSGPKFKELPVAHPKSKGRRRAVRYAKSALDEWANGLDEYTSTAQAMAT